ncbi:hypothetical protein [Actinospica robiniae]|uniref:hypothetical protein n=1 Tax=Actinospica robiniae TaxID=304901 RepID=UPI0012FA9CA2|nr:hypothetical protein [Actinospica robiniae]
MARGRHGPGGAQPTAGAQRDLEVLLGIADEVGYLGAVCAHSGTRIAPELAEILSAADADALRAVGFVRGPAHVELNIIALARGTVNGGLPFGLRHQCQKRL